jgi:hypothetical protein
MISTRLLHWGALALFIFGLPSLLPAAPPTILLSPVKGLPVGLDTVIFVRFSETEPMVKTWKLTGRDGTSIIAQRDVRTGSVLWLERTTKSRREFSVQPVAVSSDVTVTAEKTGFRFRDGKRVVLFYQRDPHSLDGKHTAANYVHPVLGLDGETLTQDFPKDHPHHHGVYWAWHQLWVGETRAGDPWVNRDFLPVVKKAEVIEQGPQFATLKILAHWTSPLVTEKPNVPTAIVEETTFIRLYRAIGDVQYVDFEITLRPLLPNVRIGGSEDKKGYSGFTVRTKPPQAFQLTDVGGVLDGDGMHRKSRWADASGRHGQDEQVSGIGILTHKTLPEFPPRWLLRHYGMQNVLYPGREAVALSPKKPLTLRHRLVIHRGDAKTARVADHQRAYELLP